MKWVRGSMLGKGSYGIVSLAIPLFNSQFQFPPLIAVKSTLLSQSSSLQKERLILSELQDCSQILHCFGDDTTTENDQMVYNLFLEYISGGTLADRISSSSTGRLPESDVRCYAKSILKGLDYMHKKGYVHCDIKPSNILVSSASDVKIADFGMAKKANEKIKDRKFCLFGTPLYMAPESVTRNQYESPVDVWSLGCVVAEMFSGKPVWTCTENTNMNSILFRIGSGKEWPEIPQELSNDGKDFLGKCFIRDPSYRWTAEMLLNHPFIVEESMEGGGVGVAVNTASSLCSALETFTGFEGESDQSTGSYSMVANQIHELAAGLALDSSSSYDDKSDVRGAVISICQGR
ncbi:mitogen-activated protein kinase kinase kinase 20-like [Magnolia sinica]|uniref:mitogen-activated protein kinase kinase kinase 20-like n=1 Tax=Magnolia sinica TaxID=86752 RepID=UPI002657B19C|nr:mitogen-activated protein kinase kinase kinase 20-like [Magnolia sinica]